MVDIDTCQGKPVVPLYMKAMNSLLCFPSNLVSLEKKTPIFFLAGCLCVRSRARKKRRQHSKLCTYTLHYP